MSRTNVTLTAADLSIEPETLSDAADIYKYMGCDSEITRYTGWNPYQTLQDATIEKNEREIRAWSHKDNLASIRVLCGAGFVETGKDGEQITFALN